jgi:hypothetical protein
MHSEAFVTRSEDRLMRSEARIRLSEDRIRESEARLMAFFFLRIPYFTGRSEKTVGINKIHTKRVYSFKFLYLKKSRTKQTFANLSKLGRKKEGLFRI